MQELEDHKIQNIQHFMKKTNPIDVVFRDKAKFDTQNPVIKDLQIAEELEHLKELNNNNNNNNNDNNNDNDDDNDNAPFVPPH